MSKQKSSGNRPLPSFLSNIRNAVQTTEMMTRKDVTRNVEFLPLIGGAEDSGVNSSTTTSSSPISLEENQKPSLSSFMKRFEITSVSRLGRAQRSRFRFRGRDRKDASAKRGFHVQMPTEIIVYVIIIFFVVPLLVGLYVLIRELLVINPRPKKLNDPLHDIVPSPQKHSSISNDFVLEDRDIDTTKSTKNDTNFTKTIFHEDEDNSNPKDTSSVNEKTLFSELNENADKEKKSSVKSSEPLS